MSSPTAAAVPTASLVPPKDASHSAPSRTTPHKLPYPRRSALASSQALLSWAIAIYVFVVYCDSCSMAIKSLVGTHYGFDGTSTVYAAYESPCMVAFLRALKLDAPSVAAAVATALQPTTTNVVYLVPSGDKYALSSVRCVVDGTVGDIQDPAVARRFLAQVYLGLGLVFSDDLVVVVDCSFDAIVTQDSSTFRAHVADCQFSYLVTVTTEAVLMERPLLRQTTICSPVILVNTTLDAIQFDPNKAGKAAFSRPLAPADVVTLVAVQYPFVDAPFVPLYIDTITDESKALARMPGPDGTTNESVVLVGTDGLYIDCEFIFAAYYTYMFKRPTDAAVNIATQQFLGVPNTKNAYAWGYLVASSVLCTTILYVVVAATAVAVTTSRTRQVSLVHTLPDVASLVTMALKMHAVAAVVCCCLDRGWGLYEWSDISAKLRTKAYRASVPLPPHIRGVLLSWSPARDWPLAGLGWSLYTWGASSALMRSPYYLLHIPSPTYIRGALVSWVVLVCHVTARLLAIHFNLAVVVALPLLLDLESIFFTGTWGLYVDLSAQYLVDISADSLTPSRPSHLAVWSYHPLLSIDPRFVVNEISGFVYATIFLVGAQVLFKAMGVLVASCRQHAAVQPMHDGPTTSFPFEDCLTHTSAHGLHAPFDKHVEVGGIVSASPAWVWHLGYVVVDDRFLFSLTDVPKLAVNIATRTDHFFIYGYGVHHTRQLTTRLHHYLHEDFESLVALTRLTLEPLTQTWPLDAEKHVNLYDAATQRSTGAAISKRASAANRD
ncbi:Aste57867_17779 [Aphanomyces stellatus]|uniref:Aste57867_17779 protein n=2 Tax=Aphanomyces stellatus TaxID=120398 RepID=A0A485L9Q2_9STRA|nr:hypothetical protein As57867_017718 [Aphanomyces stellatus]VFT94524.1 Aste57867_17779 [Aphanomyces stellatus]